MTLAASIPMEEVYSAPIKVMIVDDSIVVRSLYARCIDNDPELAVVASLRDGQRAVDDVVRANPDVVLLDLEMPVMDGLTTLPRLLELKPDLTVIIVSARTKSEPTLAKECLTLGAKACLAKPDALKPGASSHDFRAMLLDAIKKNARKISSTPKSPQLLQRVSIQASPEPIFAQPKTPCAPDGSSIPTRPYSSAIPRILVIGGSTGGPEALAEVMRTIGPAIRTIPVLITQHMPPAFTQLLAENVGREAKRSTEEGKDGELVLPGHIYIAPGNRHMLTQKTDDGVFIQLTDGPPVNYCRPAVDPMFSSAAKVYGAAVLSVVLTGMGVDGAEGVRHISQSGGSVIAQDEETSVVWGMPGAAAGTGLCSEILALGEIGPRIIGLLSGIKPWTLKNTKLSPTF